VGRKGGGVKRHEVIIGIDPGEHPGFGVIVDGVLVAGGAADPWSEFGGDNGLEAIVVVERPIITPRSNPTDIITLAITAGELASPWRRAGCDVEFVTPRRWKGSVPKHITNRRTLDALSAEERAVLPKRPRAKDYDHNMLDGVGIALWRAQRERWR